MRNFYSVLGTEKSKIESKGHWSFRLSRLRRDGGWGGFSPRILLKHSKEGIEE
jgi:hypothetical protein